MSYSESVNQKYFEVEAKCGHVGKTNCVWKVSELWTNLRGTGLFVDRRTDSG